jgi:hypothetical protein
LILLSIQTQHSAVLAETGSLSAKAREQGLENLKPILEKTKKNHKDEGDFESKTRGLRGHKHPQKLMQNFPRKKLGNLQTRVQSDRTFIKKQKNLRNSK